MPVEIEKHYVNTYKNTVQMLSQQMLSKTEQLVSVQQCTGNGAAAASAGGSRQSAQGMSGAGADLA